MQGSGDKTSNTDSEVELDGLPVVRPNGHIQRLIGGCSPARKGSRERHKGRARHGNVGVVKILDRDT
jgi:hypothetical protein